ncbi:MAG: ABC transporter ATP-binding protein [Thomasclavelia sp.]
MSSILIEANNISKVYDSDILLKRGINFYALQNVDFVLKEGDFISVMGPSGSGKSTLLNCLSTLDEATSGSIEVLGKLVSQMSDKELSLYRNKYLGFIFQNHNLVASLSIFDNIATPLILNNVAPSEIQNRVNEIAKKLKIQQFLYKKPNECSGGERQRVAIARAIVAKPKILVCDEPTGNLDSENSHELLGLLNELNQEGTSIILVTHDNMIASYAKKFVYLRDGKIINEIERNDLDQVDFFNEIVKITTQDSLLKLFNSGSKNPILQENKSVKKKNNDQKLNQKVTTNEEIEVKAASKEADKDKKASTDIDETDNDQVKKKTRRIAYAIFDGLEYDNSSKNKYRNLNFEKDYIDATISNTEYVKITYDEVEKVGISMCSRFVISFPMPENRFYLDIDIVLKDGRVYQFELRNQKNALSLFDVLKQHELKIDDPYGIEAIYRARTDYLVRHRWLLYNFKDVAEKYGLDNPRGVDVANQYNSVNPLGKK